MNVLIKFKLIKPISIGFVLWMYKKVTPEAAWWIFKVG